MCTACIQAKHTQQIIKVKNKRTTQPFELRYSNVCGPFSMPTIAGHHDYILFIHDYTRFTSVSVLSEKKSNICTSTHQSFQPQVNSIGSKVNQFRADHGRRQYENKTFHQVLAAGGTIKEPFPIYTHHEYTVVRLVFPIWPRMTVYEKIQLHTWIWYYNRLVDR
jgi:hypothetical protein